VRHRSATTPSRPTSTAWKWRILYIANIDPNSIDRVEVIRGPQASTVYGSGAIGGVMQVFTRRGGANLTRPSVEASAAIGGIESDQRDGKRSPGLFALRQGRRSVRRVLPRGSTATWGMAAQLLLPTARSTAGST
jgi:outer membrane receptor protein involved in Fe transport